MFSFALVYFSFKISQPAVKRKALSGVHARLDTPECDKPSVTQNYLFAISLIVIARRTPRRVNSKREHSEQTQPSRYINMSAENLFDVNVRDLAAKLVLFHLENVLSSSGRQGCMCVGRLGRLRAYLLKIYSFDYTVI